MEKTPFSNIFIFLLLPVNVSTVPLKNMGCGSRFQSDIVREKNDYCFFFSLTRRDNGTRGVHVPYLSPQWRLKWSF